MSNYEIPDFSFYQDDPTTPQPIDFQALRQKSRGVILRAGQNLWIDKTFRTNYANAKAAGVLRGTYYFYDSRADPKKQAEKWIEALAGDYGELEHFADFEDSYGGKFHGWKHWYNFLERVKELAPGIKLGVYTGYYYWRENTNYLTSGITPAALNYFAQYPLWIAWYNPFNPYIPAPFKGWLFWQYTDDYPSDGWGAESNEIDMNRFAGDEADFIARYRVGETPTPKGTLTVKYGDNFVEYQEKQ